MLLDMSTDQSNPTHIMQMALSEQSTAMSKGKRAAIYTRSFQARMLKNKPLEGEVERCKAYCARCGYHVDEDQIYYEVQSGSDEQGQPELDRLIAAAQRGWIDVVVITGPGRLSSSPAELITILQQFQSVGVKVETTEPSFLDRTKPTEQAQVRGSIQSRQKKRSRWTGYEIAGAPTIQQQNALRRVAIYAKGDADSLQEQVKRCKAYCTSNGYEIGKDQLYAEVREGSDEQDSPELNPELSRLTAVAKGGLIDVVVLTNVQMFTRRPSYLAVILQTLQGAGVQVETIE
jgi:DNA invertase Pin-like site-specific DNA recombinase